MKTSINRIPSATNKITFFAKFVTMYCTYVDRVEVLFNMLTFEQIRVVSTFTKLLR